MRAHPDKIFAMVQQISENILDHLEIHALSMSRTDLKGLPITTKSPEAFHHFILGMESNWNEGEPQGMGSFEHFISAIEIDSTFTSAYVFLSMYASHLGDYNTAKDYLLRALMVKEEISKKMQFWIDALKKMYFDKDPYGTIENFKKSTDLDPLSRYDWLLLAWSYSLIEQHADAQAAYEQISRINHILGKWDNSTYYLGLAQTYISMGKYIKARKVLLSGQKFFPDNPAIHRELAKCALMRDQLRVAEKYFEKYRQVRKINGWKDAQITAYIGKIYYEAGMTEKALEFYDRALEIRRIEGPAIDTINPGNNLHWYYNVLAMVLLEQDLDVEKGMAYARKAYDLSQDTSYPSHPMILKRLALAFYKQGNTSEALRLLNQAEQGLSIYDHFIHQWKIKLETEIYQRNKSTQGPSHYTKMIS
jgi:tetratricopeptide (TPR) repeat protein